MNNQELILLKRIIKTAGEILLKGYNKNLTIRKKEDNSLVCDADEESSAFIYRSLKTNFSNYGIIDEERENHPEESYKKYCWVVDPLDATRGYLDKEDIFSILIGLLKNKKPIFGISYRPAINEIAFAIKGKGAYLEDSEGIRKIKTNSSAELNVLITKSGKSNELEEILKKINPLKIKKMGGSTKIIEIAKGNANLFICPKERIMHSWDLCAPQIILEESGGKMTDLNGKVIDYSNEDCTNHNGVIAASEKIYKTVIKKILQD